jgi:predicted DNA-binding protein (UPF0251 family)
LPRPAKPRHVDFTPTALFFKPAGIPLRQLEVATIGLAEIEALRLKDVEGLDQAECAQQMRISRPTFQRILTAARQKVSMALVSGNAIRVEVSPLEPEIHNTTDGYCPHCDAPGHRHRRCNQETT